MNTRPDKEATDNRGRPQVEIYKPVAEHHHHAYRVVAIAADDSPEALQAAKEVALRVEQQLYDELESRLAERKKAKGPSTR